MNLLQMEGAGLQEGLGKIRFSAVAAQGSRVEETFPIFLWKSPTSPDSEGTVNMYRAFSTNQMDLSQVVFGNFEDDVFGMWGGLDIVIDPYTSAQTASVNVTINAFVDNAVRHSASFAWSTDSGAQ